MTSLSGIFLPSFSPGMLRWGEVNIMVKRSKLILIGALLATILVIIEIVIYGGLAGQTPADPETAEEVGTAIGTTIGLAGSPKFAALLLQLEFCTACP